MPKFGETPGGGPSTIRIAASDSDDRDKVNANLVCGGSDDGTPIVDFLGENNFKDIRFAPGNYYIAEGGEMSITPAAFINRLRLSLHGAIFNYPAGSGVPLTINSNLGVDSLWEKRRIIIEGGMFIGNASALALIRANDISGLILRDMNLYDLTAIGDTNNGAVLLYGSQGGQTECVKLENIVMRNVSRGLNLRTAVAGYSYNVDLDNIWIECMTEAGAGIAVPDHGNWYRSLLKRVTVFLTANWSIGFDFGGCEDMESTTLQNPAVEEQSSPVNCKGINLGAGAHPHIINPMLSGNFHQGKIVGSPALVLPSSIPTSDPGVVGELWSSSGTIKISSG